MKKNSVATDIAYAAVFTALIIVFAFVSIPSPVSGVPIVIQNAVITLAGLVLGGRRGFFVGLLFIVLGLVGLPVLAGGRSVISALPGPTVGYIAGYLISPAIGGAVAYRAPRNKTGLAIMITVAGFVSLLIQYACGTVGLALRAGMGWGEAALAQIPFLGPDALKLVIMIIIAIGVHSAFPGLMGRKPVTKKAESAA